MLLIHYNLAMLSTYVISSSIRTTQVPIGAVIGKEVEEKIEEVSIVRVRCVKRKHRIFVTHLFALQIHFNQPPQWQTVARRASSATGYVLIAFLSTRKR